MGVGIGLAGARMGLGVARGYGAAVAASPLLTGLVAYWKLDGAADSVGANTLTDVGGVGFVAGKQGNAASFASGKYFYVNDNPALSMGGDIAFTVAAWVYLTGYGGLYTYKGVVDKTQYNNDEYLLGVYTENGIAYAGFGIQKADNSAFVRATKNQNLALNTWYLLIGWHDPDTNAAYVSVNNGVAASATVAGGARDGTRRLEIGRSNNTPGQYFPGHIDEVGIWKRALTTDEKAYLYNSGAGRTYPFS